MLALRLVPKLYYYDTFKEFHEEFKIGKNDVILTNQWLYEPYIKPLGIETNVVLQEKYGMGEPSDEMMDGIYQEMSQYNYDRIIAFGGGTILDICKVLALKYPGKALDLYTGAAAPVKEKTLIAVPTTCGTGSEVTNVAIAELKSLHTKKGIAVDETYADAAVLIPETMKGLPYKVFVTSSVDALIHGIEAFVSPFASPLTDILALEAIKMIMAGYKAVVEKGEDERFNHMKDFVLASNYAGIAFGNAGVGAVHALSYAIGGAFHVPHGEANYQFFTEVFKMYQRKAPKGKIEECNKVLAEVLGCDVNGDVYGELEAFLNKLIAKKPLKEYGMVEAQIDEFTDMTIANQQRLLSKNYVPLDRAEIREIFANLY